MTGEPLSLLFYVVVILLAIIAALMAIKIVFRDLPLWLFEYWPHLAGLFAGVVLYFQFNWKIGLGAFIAGIVLGMIWSAILNKHQRLGRENSRLEALHWKLIKWARK